MRVPKLASGVLAVALALSAVAEEPTVKRARRDAPDHGRAMKIHVDPATGELVPSAPPARIEAVAPARAEALPPLKVETVTAKAGGKMVRLDGRFMMELTATLAPNGTVLRSCEASEAKDAAPAKEPRHVR